jgi:hypothetical protein
MERLDSKIEAGMGGSWVNNHRIRTELLRDNAERYMCPFCLVSGPKPSLIKHNPDCAYANDKKGAD